MVQRTEINLGGGGCSFYPGQILTETFEIVDGGVRMGEYLPAGKMELSGLRKSCF